MSEIQTQSSFYKTITKALVPVIFILVGGAAWAYFKVTAPVIDRKPAQRQSTVVTIHSVVESEVLTSVSVMGTVFPSCEVTVKARVSGEINSVADAFIPGGHFYKGETMVSMDSSDHQISLQKAQSALDEVRGALAIEKGSQTIAREEIRLLSELSSDAVEKTDLALRKPQLMQAEAVVAGAEADLRQARLELDRTIVYAPFNALVIERNVNIGSYVGAQDSLATLVGTDEFWVKAVVPLDKLALIDINHDGGCPAVIRSQAGDGRWEARVLCIAGKINETSRMATVILAISDPLGLQKDKSSSRLLIDDYVFVDISGRVMAGVIKLPRAALQDDNTVWVYVDKKLEIRTVTLAWKNSESVYIQSGLTPGEKVIVSGISSPVNGMSLMVVTNETSQEEVQL